MLSGRPDVHEPYRLGNCVVLMTLPCTSVMIKNECGVKNTKVSSPIVCTNYACAHRLLAATSCTFCTLQALTKGGCERTLSEWSKLFAAAGLSAPEVCCMYRGLALLRAHAI